MRNTKTPVWLVRQRSRSVVPRAERAWTKVIQRIHGNGYYVFIYIGSMGNQAAPLILAKNGLRYDSVIDGHGMSEELKEKAFKARNSQKSSIRIDSKRYP